MNNEYHLVTVLLSGCYANMAIEGSVIDFVIRNKGRDLVILKSWPISEEKYELYNRG